MERSADCHNLVHADSSSSSDLEGRLLHCLRALDIFSQVGPVVEIRTKLSKLPEEPGGGFSNVKKREIGAQLLDEVASQVSLKIKKIIGLRLAWIFKKGSLNRTAAALVLSVRGLISSVIW